MTKYNTKLLTLFTVFLVTLGIGMASQPSPQMSINTSSPNVEQGEIGSPSLLDSLDKVFLSLTASNTQVEPGETVNFKASVDSTEYREDTSNLVKVVEFYRCDDAECNDPNSFVDSDTDFADFSTYLFDETKVWEIQYTVPEQESRYEAVAYIYDSSTDKVVSTTSTEQFDVGSFTYDDGSTDDGTTTSDVDLQLAASPYFEVDEQSNSVDGNIVIGNYGSDDMSGSDIVEMQVRSGTQNPLSLASVQGTCDSDYPNNVHKEYSIDAQDSLNIDLTADTGLEDGQQYTVYFLTRGECGGDRTDPIRYSNNAGSFSFKEEDDDSGGTDPESEEPKVEQVSKPQLSFDDGTVSTRISFKNTGGDMSQSDIVEMQVRPEGAGPLAFSSVQDVCDEDYPNNVHKEFSLDSGETATTTLSTDVSETGEYDVYLLTRDACYPDNGKVQPYENSYNAGTVTVNPGFVGFVETVEQNALVLVLAVGGFILLAGGAVLRWL